MDIQTNGGSESGRNDAIAPMSVYMADIVKAGESSDAVSIADSSAHEFSPLPEVMPLILRQVDSLLLTYTLKTFPRRFDKLLIKPFQKHL